MSFSYKGIQYVNCDMDSEENGYNYRCPRIHSDDWDELDDPCAHCTHRTWATLEEFKRGEADRKGGTP